MTNPNSVTLNENIGKLKTEGGDRAQRIGKIFQAALSETVSELKDGATTMKPMAQEVTTEVVEKLKVQGYEAAVKLDETLAQNLANQTETDRPQEADAFTQLKSLLRKVLQLIQSKLAPQPQVPLQHIEAGKID